MFLHVSVGLEAVQQLSVETESEGSVRVRWGHVGGVTAYRLVWGPFTGQPTSNNSLRFCQSVFFFFFYHFAYLYIFIVHKGRNVETVELAGDSEFHTLPNLQPDTEYIVTIIPVYEGNTEGPVATARFKIGRFLEFIPTVLNFSL